MPLDVDAIIEAEAQAEKDAVNDPIVAALLGIPTKGKWETFARTCSHNMDEFTFSDGTVVYASEMWAGSFRDEEDEPDFAVYLDRGWDKGQAYALFPYWPDFGIPADSFRDFHKVLVSILLHSRAGATVEVGCIGSHGRTGTLLALLEVLASEGNTTAKEAIAKVRSEHCHKAIENGTQEWYVEAYRAWLLGIRIPPMPAKKRFQPKKATVTVTKAEPKQEKGNKKQAKQGKAHRAQKGQRKGR
jgi:hypothetical protein